MVINIIFRTLSIFCFTRLGRKNILYSILVSDIRSKYDKRVSIDEKSLL